MSDKTTDKVNQASFGVGLAAGTATAVFGAPLWGAILVGSAFAFITKKVIDKASV